jgi:threonine dehydratase
MNTDSAQISIDQFESAQRTIYRAIDPSPQIAWPVLAQHCGTEVWVKHENHLPTGSFKVRGGLLYAQHLEETLSECNGLIAATRGNHGQSVAFAARRHGIKAVIVVPRGNSPDKNRAMLAYGCELIEHGEDFNEALDHAKQLRDERGLILFPSFDPVLVRGVGTYGIELLRAVPDLDTIYVPIGLGSGICGLIAARNALNSKTRIVGVVASAADAYARSFERKRVVATKSADTMADGLAVRIPDPQALSIILAGAERIISVSDAEIMAAIAVYFSTTHNVAEGAGAAPLAALLKERDRFKGDRVGLILSGANIDREQFARIIGGQ